MVTIPLAVLQMSVYWKEKCTGGRQHYWTSTSFTPSDLYWQRVTNFGWKNKTYITTPVYHTVVHSSSILHEEHTVSIQDPLLPSDNLPERRGPCSKYSARLLLWEFNAAALLTHNEYHFTLSAFCPCLSHQMLQTWFWSWHFFFRWSLSDSLHVSFLASRQTVSPCQS